MIELPFLRAFDVKNYQKCPNASLDQILASIGPVIKPTWPHPDPDLKTLNWIHTIMIKSAEIVCNKENCHISIQNCIHTK